MVTFPIDKGIQRAIIVLACIFIVLPLTATILRVCARRKANRKLDASDYLIILACVGTHVYQSLCIFGTFHAGVGWHADEIKAKFGNLDSNVLLFKIIICIQFLWSLTLCLTKLSILVLYSKIFDVPAFVWAARATGLVVVGYTSSTLLMGFFLCQPFSMNRDKDTPGGRCGDQLLSYLVTAGFNIVTDVIVLLLPIPYLVQLNLALYKKFVLVGTFSFGIITVIISILRTISLTVLDDADYTGTLPLSFILSALEPSIGVTLASIPLLRPLLGRYEYSATGTLRDRRQDKTPGGPLADAAPRSGLRAAASRLYPTAAGGGVHSSRVGGGALDGAGGAGKARRRPRGHPYDDSIDDDDNYDEYDDGGNSSQYHLRPVGEGKNSVEITAVGFDEHTSH